MAPTHAFLAPHMPLWHLHVPFWRPICLYGAHTCLFGTPYAFMTPTHAFLVPQLPLWCPHMSSWHPICLFGVHLPLRRPICLLAPLLPFVSPICLLAPQFFWWDPWHNMSGSQKGHWFLNPHGAICGWYNHHVQQSISSTNCFCNFLQHLSHVSGCASIRVIILFGHIREKVLF